MTDTTAEIWRPVHDFEGLYEVSNRGQVRSLPRTVPCGAGRVHTSPGRVLTPVLRGGNALAAVSLSCAGKITQVYLHTLVQQAFGEGAA